MRSSIARTPFPLSPTPTSLLPKSEICRCTNPSIFIPLKPITCVLDPTPLPKRSSLSCPNITPSTVSQKLQNLDAEFKSLSEPIERVKRLLQYATILPPFDESSRIQENRVLGCTSQVWLEVRMDGNDEVMRFRVDSDSEITKGFCSCLIWILDGAKPDEVLNVKADDLIEMNVGLPSRRSSRVNTWHNVLISMQRRTKDLVEAKQD